MILDPGGTKQVLEKLWLSQPWKCSRPGWMGLGAKWSSGICPECGESWKKMSFKVPSNPTHPVSPWKETLGFPEALPWQGEVTSTSGSLKCPEQNPAVLYHRCWGIFTCILWGIFRGQCKSSWMGLTGQEGQCGSSLIQQSFSFCDDPV